MGKSKENELIPSARRLVTSLRDMGYDFSAAVADLVDNSIEAKASTVAIQAEFNGDNSWVRIADNGCGMATATLREAMRYGAERDYSDDDLGKFGLGLKTASMSQSQRLTVVSRPRGTKATCAAFCWDLEHIQKVNRWEVLPLRKSEFPECVVEALEDGHNTAIVWERLDRILGYKHPYGDAARKRFAQMCRDLEDHLAMVFHRFLNGEARGRRIRIILNGNPVEPWDPFARKEPRTRKLEACSIPFEQDGISGEILVQPYVLPHEDRFSSPEARAKASGPLKWNRQQGFYIYRADRLIQSGGWSNLRTLDEHTKLARVAVSFSPKLDEAFKINVAKMRVQMPAIIREDLEEVLKPVLKAAQAEYRRGGHTDAAPSSPFPPTKAAPVSSATPLTSNPPAASLTAPVVRRFTLGELRKQLDSVASEVEMPVIAAVCDRLEQKLSQTP